MIPLKNLYSGKILIEMCQHIVSHEERYEPERVFEAKEIINNTQVIYND